MQKYKIVASKSQKKYTLIISADSESHAKEKLHKENYSILSIQEVDNKEISGNKFLFQIEKNGEMKNGIIVGKDIFKVYMKLRDELEYNVVFLYPEGDEAHNSAEKKQFIMEQLLSGYELQKKEIKLKNEKGDKEEKFYMQKSLNETYVLINKSIEKFDAIFNNREVYNIDDETFYKLEKIYEKLIHIKSSTNISKLKEIGELALVKIAKLELKNIEKNKNKQSRELLQETNNLLKKIGSNQHFVEKDKDVKKKMQAFFSTVLESFSRYQNEKTERKNKPRELIDKDSYGFLKTVLLLEKYKDKLHKNNQEIYKNIFLYMNPFSSSPLKEKISLKRRVIKQNISILKAKKSGGIGSYTSIKKGYGKTIKTMFDTLKFLGNIIVYLVYVYVCIFLLVFTLLSMDVISFEINTYPIIFLLLSFIFLFVLHISKNILLLGLNLVFLSFLFIFSVVNF